MGGMGVRTAPFFFPLYAPSDCVLTLSWKPESRIRDVGLAASALWDLAAPLVQCVWDAARRSFNSFHLRDPKRLGPVHMALTRPGVPAMCPLRHHSRVSGQEARLRDVLWGKRNWPLPRGGPVRAAAAADGCSAGPWQAPG
ncbi:hypothetical protein PAL_GLEAN10011249 [Pteropus alecto]|uniref:Uncharacterized protein n=1 Tax=Pteropus alecto TaxID=9402 RepID=L5KPX0_PTEAL|nr:hypothetical protein PAL_GLEAN10011249 [Pteropus alecto]